MDENDLHEDSDSSDEDYIPENKQEVLSEEDSDGVVEDFIPDSEDSPKKRKGRKTIAGRTKKLKKGNEEENSINNDKAQTLTDEDQKKKADDIWADFLQDTGFKPRSSIIASKSNISEPKKNSIIKEDSKEKKNEVEDKTEKTTITEIFEFAGEEVRVEKEVPKNSAEARLLGPSNSKNTNTRKGGNLSGIGSVLSQLGKKKKISTLEKTKLDWDKFKKDEKIEEELTAYKKGKDGYLERQDFLERADLRRFEIEKEIRTVERNKRMTMGDAL